ncbi:phosphatidylserine decarboxylase [Rickettsiales endosymbiont of Peranema trichophorum]|uniref:phosphatidylserine decarboxylase n=1 Tax=Rickettsiales endosymbiont of Peranema trichophorum TaxID=2486577 RepID=UPI001023D856|nr:phosphatidylserine decarboxylase [Rickettsiales endosymbiont of Peranema trichophorum]RZI46347.1 phosphatidylserine decarboxylase [Rickettsiales endosymbiont of Peranema trichophorum]
MIEPVAAILPSIHREGYVFIMSFILATLVCFAFSKTIGWIGIILTLWCVYFFRDPDRVTPIDKSLIISPADGLVQAIQKAPPPPELNMEAKELTRVSIFLNVFDVHVNRVPISGVVKNLSYHPGKFLNASLDKASKDNERQSILIETDDRQEIVVVQIAGLIARRIVCNLNDKQKVKAGARFGIIRFGSRVDVYLPAGIEPMVLEGQRVIGGETVLANLIGEQKKRHGKVYK